MNQRLTYKDHKEVFVEKERNGVFFLEIPLLAKTGMIRHGFSTRIGGVSEGIYSEMNLSFVRGDEEARVQENFRRMAEAVGVKLEDFTFSKQTHTTNVRVVEDGDRGAGMVRPTDYEDVDGLVTNVPGICLATFYADCVPLYFVDPIHRAIGLSHSGWRGTVGKIGKATVELMEKTYGTNPEDVVAAIGPSICQDCYEVSADVIEEVKSSFAEEQWPALFYQKDNGKYQLNLWEANRMVFLEAGIQEERIAVTNVCTCCNSELLFSHRASQGKRGNLGAFLALKEEV